MTFRMHSLWLAVTIVVPGLVPLPVMPSEDDQPEILYWVAPMDPNYRRDGPGKSPMGMDLVPVYADEAGGSADVVSIDPAVVQNLGVRTAPVERATLWRRIETVGYVAFDERKLSHVHLRTEGWIESLNVKSDGEQVKKGDVLFELYSRELVNAQEEYIQALDASNDYLKRASRERLDALGMSENQIREVARTRHAAQRVRVLANQDGIVHALKAREGMFVKPEMEVMTLADLSTIWLLVDVFERHADWVAEGQPAEVRMSYLPGKVWEGKVEFVYPTVDPKTRTLRARLLFDNADAALKPDMYADVRVFAGPEHDVLSVPREALIRTGESERVIIALGDGKFSAREVVAGIESGDWVEIISGIKEGDNVVTSGQFLIDSEASLKASFNRMGSDDIQGESDTTQTPFTGTGTVNEIFPDARKLNLSHKPIEALGWPAMTMDFRLTDNAMLEGVEAGAVIHFTLLKDDTGSFRVDSIQVQE
ncbi:MAG: efflux RND transporter periplasmic adaptor subunit [Thiogranum sp.]|nr:efflux RND transporter periplasmic adaptor subunit [Thiogranum sp.]